MTSFELILSLTLPELHTFYPKGQPYHPGVSLFRFIVPRMFDEAEGRGKPLANAQLCLVTHLSISVFLESRSLCDL